MKLDSYNSKLALLSVILVITVFATFQLSFRNNIPTCNRYVINVYMYLFLALLLFAMTILVAGKLNIALTETKSLIFLAIAFVALFALSSVQPQQVVLNHIIWLVFIVSLAMSVYPSWRYSQHSGTITTTIITTTILVAILTAVVFWKPEWIRLSWQSTLSILLLGALIASIVPILFNINVGSNYQRLISIFFVGLFSMFLLVDTKRVIAKSLVCEYPDYPRDSVGLFVDVLVLASANSG